MASSSSHPSNVVALPSMTHSLAHLPTMPAVDPRCLHYGSLGASKEASHAKLQQTLQRRDPSICPSSNASHDPSLRRPPPPQPSPRKTGPPAADDDGDYLMMKKGRKT